MKVLMDVSGYSKEQGFQFNWVNGFEIETRITDGVVHISANKAGLLSLANHLLNLAQDDVPPGYHLHLDDNNSLQDGSVVLILSKEK